jgi:hypothetical protein
MQIRLAGAVAVACVLMAAPGRAQEAAGISPEGKSAAEALLRASWNGSSSVNGFAFKVRAAPIFSRGFIDAVSHVPQLSTAQRAAIDGLVEVTIPAEGWFMGQRVAPGSYRVGLSKAPRYLHWTLRDAKGAKVATEPIWLEGRRSENPGNQVSMSDGAFVARLTVGDGIAFDWRYVTLEQHDQAAAAPHTVTEGNVTLITDIGHAATVAAMAKELAASVPHHAKLLGVPQPKEPLFVYLYRDKAHYERMDRMLSGGEFLANGGVTAALNNRSYAWYVPWSTPIAFDDHGATLSMRSLCIHELHHQIAARFYASIEAWPKWVGEGLAELGTWRALQAGDAAAGDAYLAHAQNLWRNAGRSGVRPPIEDYFADDQSCGIKVWYAGALLMARQMDGLKPGQLAALIPFFEGEPVYRNLRRRVLREVERRWAPLPELWSALNGAADKSSAGPVPVWGQADRVDRGGAVWRCVADVEGQSRLLFPDSLTGPDVLLEGEFAFHHAGGKQVDLYFGYRMGRETGRFVKVAIRPKQITLMHWGHDGWRTWGHVTYEKELIAGNPKKPTWYDFTLAYTAESRVVRVEFAGGRWAQWVAPEYVPVAGTHFAVGCWDTIAFFRNVRAR